MKKWKSSLQSGVVFLPLDGSGLPDGPLPLSLGCHGHAPPREMSSGWPRLRVSLHRMEMCSTAVNSALPLETTKDLWCHRTSQPLGKTRWVFFYFFLKSGGGGFKLEFCFKYTCLALVENPVLPLAAGKQMIQANYGRSRNVPSL